MNEEKTVLQRLERLQGIANDAKIAYLDEDEPVDSMRPAEDLDEIRAGIGNIVREVKECLEDDVQDCVHCGSPFTYRRSDGDIECKDCRGIMPRLYECDGCGVEGPRHELVDDECEFYDDGHELYPSTRVCPLCGEQGTPHEIQTHTCEVTQ